MTHDELVQIAVRWLQKRCSVVITEMATMASETPDAIGWQGRECHLVECKVSTSDFRRDLKKRTQYAGSFVLGNSRWYFAPEGIIPKSRIPEGWGFVEVGEKLKPKMVVVPVSFESTGYSLQVSNSILLSALRRVVPKAVKGISVKYYTYETKNRATIGVRI